MPPYRRALPRTRGSTFLPFVALVALGLGLSSGCTSMLTITNPHPYETISSTTVTIELSYTQCDYTTLRVWLNDQEITSRFTKSDGTAVAVDIPVRLGPNTLSATIQANAGYTLEARTTFYCVLEPQRFAVVTAPTCLAFDTQGYLYVGTDQPEGGPAPLYRISPDGTDIEPFGPALSKVGGVSVDDAGNVIVGAGGSDAGIYRIAPSGAAEQIVSGSGVFTELHSLVAVPKVSQLTYRLAGLYFAAVSLVEGGDALLAIDPLTRRMWSFTDQLPSPIKAIALNPDAQLLVLAGGKIYLVDGSGNATMYLELQCSLISSFAINHDGLYFATNPCRQQMVLITSTADFVPVAYEVSDIQTLAIGPDGKMYVADKGADAILRIPFDFNVLKTGTCELTPQDPVEANTMGTWTLRYTVGPAGMNVAGGLLIGFRHPLDWGSYQSFYPSKPNYMTSRCSRSTTFATARPAWLIADRFIQVTLAGSSLEQGDWIEVTLGDTRYGSPGQEAPSIAVEDTEWFVFDDIYGKGIYDSIHSIAPERVPRMTILHSDPVRLSLALKSYADVSEPFTVIIKALDAYGNIAQNYTGVVDIYDHETLTHLATAVFQAEDRGVKEISYISYDSPGIIRLLVRDQARNWEVVSNPVEISADASRRTYWGDIHGHSFFSDALPSPNEYYYHARVLNQMDFGALTDHLGGRYEIRALTAIALNEKTYEDVKAAAAYYNEPGSFVTFVGLENSASFGHRNVYYLIDNPSFFEYSTSPTTFFQAVRSSAPQGNVMVIGHQHNGIPGQSGIDWSTIATDLERLVEICSNKGVREYKGNRYFECDTAAMQQGDLQVVTQDALAMGYRLGFVAGSDNHTGWPGGEGAPGKNLCPIFGLTGVRAEALTREAIWQALYNRRTVATTGAKILLDFYINGEPIGSELDSTQERNLEIEVHATAPIQSLDIIKNNEVLYSLEHPGLDVVGLTLSDGPSSTVDYYYVRVIQEDGHIAWCSPIWIGP